MLILADNQLESEDLEMLVSYCPKLEYLELFMNKLTDVGPLKKLTCLKDLNLAHNQISDVSPLLEMPWLQRLWIAHNQFGTDQQGLLKQSLPDTAFEFEAWSSTNGWRGDHPHYLAIYESFHTYRYVPFED